MDVLNGAHHNHLVEKRKGMHETPSGTGNFRGFHAELTEPRPNRRSGVVAGVVAGVSGPEWPADGPGWVWPCPGRERPRDGQGGAE